LIEENNSMSEMETMQIGGLELRKADNDFHPSHGYA